MVTDLFAKDYNEYISALMDLVVAQKKAKEFSALFPQKSSEKDLDLTLRGIEAINRLFKAYEVYDEKYKVWKNVLTVYKL
jgi:hypothetical protein